MVEQFSFGSERLVYEIFGDPASPPILLVHGWLSHRGVWRQTILALQEKYYCIALDLLGLGDSDKPAQGDYSIAAQAKRILALADHLKFEKFGLIGHSMGGQICTYLAARVAPERVQYLVSVAGVVTGKLMPEVENKVYPLINLVALVPPLQNLSWYLSRWKPFTYFIFHPWFHDMDSIPLASWEVDRRMALRPEIAVSARQTGRAIHQCDLTTDLSNVLAPTLGIYGRNEGTVPFSDGELLQRLIPNAQLVAIERCGHFPMYEQTRTYLDALINFIDRHCKI
jgi:pimeloyl-ACP methyl ester carboxylesterase